MPWEGKTAAPVITGLQSVDVSSLEKGLYVITVLQPKSNQLILKKLIKN